MPLVTSLRWSLVIPVKVLALAKSRLTGAAGPRRAELALAMAADTVAAAAACAAVDAVIVVTDDEAAAAELSGLGALVLPDEPGDGLNPALAFGAAYSGERWPGRGRAGMAADLPALDAAELGRALARAAGAGQAFVADAAGTGTTLYTARPGAAFRPRFGPGSHAAHLAAGAVELTMPGLDGLRRDVDTLADLRDAARIGLGPRTSAVAGSMT
ncbi:MAG TPA: 2-phospho-L-lactate guanylyltransferase [Streptosporangiaceae bacterium]|nr:2-phospho-L-lactate guanylyltransferase [Streptosporangiaceae bacterium]